MGKQRAPLTFADDLEDFNPEEWAPKPETKQNKVTISDKAEIQKVAKASGFKSREAPPETDAAPSTERRIYRTGRSEQLNLKIRTVDKEKFYALCNQQGWVMGLCFQRAIEALERELGTEKGRGAKFEKASA